MCWVYEYSVWKQIGCPTNYRFHESKGTSTQLNTRTLQGLDIRTWNSNTARLSLSVPINCSCYKCILPGMCIHALLIFISVLD